MRIGLLITSIGNFGQKGFYNAQEIGLAKELDKFFEEVIVYKAILENQAQQVVKIEGCSNSTLHQIPVRSKGINGIWDCKIMDTSIDALIYFSDTQLSVPEVYRWCKKNDIKLFPYIGVVESHSTSKIKKIVIDALFHRNVKVYKKCVCFVKTPTVERKLNNIGIRNTVVTPVGLDISLLKEGYKVASPSELKRKYGYSENDKVLLFIGRLIEEKQPVRMIEILSEVKKKDNCYKLLMVGKGELKQAVEDKINELNLIGSVQMIAQIPNGDIWELYRFADAFVNLNQQEIFGMAILEAMYYGCKVVAWNAPGPNLIIEDGKSGCLADNTEVIVDIILNKQLDKKKIYERIAKHFTWQNTALTMKQKIQTNIEVKANG